MWTDSQRVFHQDMDKHVQQLKQRQAHLWQTQADRHICSDVQRLSSEIRLPFLSLSCCLSLSVMHTCTQTEASGQIHRRTTQFWGPELHLLTVCLMIINEPSRVGREALSHPLHRQEEDWEPQGHPTVSISLPNDSSCSLTCTNVRIQYIHAHRQSGTQRTMPRSPSYTAGGNINTHRHAHTWDHLEKTCYKILHCICLLDTFTFQM